MKLIRPGLATFSALMLTALTPCQDGKTEPVTSTPAVQEARKVPPVAPAVEQFGHQQPGQQPGNTWFPQTDINLGTFFGEGEATGVFEWRNPTDQAVEWRNLQGNCQCLRARITVADRLYELQPKQAHPLVRIVRGEKGGEQREPVSQIAIGGHEAGTVEVYLDMHGITGPKMATLDLHTTDPALPHMKLRWNAVGAQLFTISPPEVQLNKMTWSETKDFTVTVMSPLKKDFEILRMDDAGKSFQVSYEKKMNGELAVWTITGKYGPVGEETAGGGVLKFHTDVNGSTPFSVRVMAFVQGPLEVKPGGFLTLGMIRQGSSLHKEIVFEPNDGQNLELTGFRFEKLRGSGDFLKVTSSKDGNKLVVDLEVLDSAPTGLLKGDLVVELNHPLVKEKRIMFNGYVR